MTHLIDRLVDELGYPRITLADHDAFVDAEGMNVLFFPGDPSSVRDATDVAVILPELVKAFGSAFRPRVVSGMRGDAATLRQRYGFKEFPALVFVRGGDYVGAIVRVQNWTDYLQEIERLLAAEPTRAPGFAIPVVTEAPRQPEEA